MALEGTHPWFVSRVERWLHLRWWLSCGNPFSGFRTTETLWGFWKASFAIGALWGQWHAPVIVAGYNYPSFPFTGVLVMMIACAAFSPLYTFLVIRAQSVLAAAFLHGVFNGSAGIVFAFAVTDTAILRELVASPVGAAGILAFGIATVGIAAWGTPHLSREFARNDP